MQARSSTKFTELDHYYQKKDAQYKKFPKENWLLRNTIFSYEKPYLDLQYNFIRRDEFQKAISKDSFSFIPDEITSTNATQHKNSTPSLSKTTALMGLFNSTSGISHVRAALPIISLLVENNKKNLSLFPEDHILHKLHTIVDRAQLVALLTELLQKGASSHTILAGCSWEVLKNIFFACDVLKDARDDIKYVYH